MGRQIQPLLDREIGRVWVLRGLLEEVAFGVGSATFDPDGQDWQGSHVCRAFRTGTSEVTTEVFLRLLTSNAIRWESGRSTMRE